MDTIQLSGFVISQKQGHMRSDARIWNRSFTPLSGFLKWVIFENKIIRIHGIISLIDKVKCLNTWLRNSPLVVFRCIYYNSIVLDDMSIILLSWKIHVVLNMHLRYYRFFPDPEEFLFSSTVLWYCTLFGPHGTSKILFLLKSTFHPRLKCSAIVCPSVASIFHQFKSLIGTVTILVEWKKREFHSILKGGISNGPL